MKGRVLTVLAALLVSISAHSLIVPRVIYGDDDRFDIYQVQNPVAQKLADSTVAMIPLNRLSSTTEGIRVQSGAFGQEYGLCQDERFYSQPNAAMCSGFLVGPDLVATAGHCADVDSCGANAWVFGYRMANENTPPLVVPASEVYRCKGIIKREQTNNQDYAVIKLDRPVTNHAPLTLANRRPVEGENIFVIGHPSGLPTKIAAGATVRKLGQGFFTGNTDTYGGNSGSAIFSLKTSEVLGILVRGEEDFEYNAAKQCTASKLCGINECRGEDATYIEYVTKVIGLVGGSLRSYRY